MELKEKIANLPETDAKDLLFLAVQELYALYECENCEHEVNCGLNFVNAKYHCQNVIFKDLENSLKCERYWKTKTPP